ncbi:MAG: SCP2 sterol-binding domain-containing protein [Pseudomonadota bacterium]
MPEVQVLDDDLNGLGWAIKSLVDRNLEHPEIQRRLKKISGSLVVTEKDADVTVTLLFRQGDPAIRNGAVEKPSAVLAGGFEELSEVISGQVGPVRALLTGRIKARGNLIKLLAMARVLISRDKG